MSRPSPLGAFAAGLAAGFVGALAQNLFFASTRQLAPLTATDALQASLERDRAAWLVEPRQLDDLPTQTLARRVTDPLETTPGSAQAVHLGFGSAWGGAYGLAAGTLPRLGTLKGGLGLGMLVWLVSEDVSPRALRSKWPERYPIKGPVYALVAHAVYGAAVSATFAALGRAAAPATAEVASLWLTRRVPRLLRPSARRVVRRGVRLALPLRDAWLALS